MLRLSVITILLALLLVALGQASAAPFVNLDFEQSTVKHTDPMFVPTSAAFPGWTALLGESSINTVYHDYSGGGEGAVVIYDEPPPFFAIPLLQGQYMPVLIRDTAFGFLGSLQQSGDIPNGTKSLQLLADGGRGPPVVSVNGTVIPMIHLSGLPFNGFTDVYGGDVGNFAGSTVTLRISARSLQGFDDIQFSASSIPEPTSVTVLLTSLLGLLSRRRTPMKSF